MAEITIKAQSKLSYEDIQEVARMLPAAVNESYPGEKPDAMKIINGITAAATGINNDAFFCVANVDGKTVAFCAGLAANDVFSNRRFARTMFTWIAPAHRNKDTWKAINDAFESWAKEGDAQEIRAVLLASTSERFEPVAKEHGYVRAGIVVVKKVK